MKLNNKGMAISGILYSILVLFLVLLFGILALLASGKYTLDKLKSDITNKLSGVSVDSDATEVGPIYEDAILNGAYPIIKDNLIPVTITDDGTVTYADLTDTWYIYEDKVWANAVILSSGSYEVGDIIPNDNIQSYFVWIPKYSYQLWNVGTTSPTNTKFAISIKFSTTNTSDDNSGECTTPRTSGGSGNCSNGEYMTSPAFITLGTNGFWVGKYETGFKGATTSALAEVSSADSGNIIVKPSVYSWRNNSVYNIFLSSYNYNRALDSHMMKNTEWGAVAYFSHSIYGINKEVNINNNSSSKTGYSALTTTNQSTYPGTSGDGVAYNSAYNSDIGYLASTTGNISGVYGMSGGAWEYMASYMSGQLGSSGFTPTTIATFDSKYFDIYSESSTHTSYNYRILGDATGEMGPFLIYQDGDNAYRYHNSWYADDSYFVDSSYPWFNRGGYYSHGILAGQFCFRRDPGSVDVSTSSRLVLAPSI